MVDQRDLIFLEPKAYYDPKRLVVIFWGKDRDKQIRCEIEWEALSDHFGLNIRTHNPLKIFEANRAVIEHEARSKYLANGLEQDGSILIKTKDL